MGVTFWTTASGFFDFRPDDRSLPKKLPVEDSTSGAPWHGVDGADLAGASILTAEFGRASVGFSEELCCCSWRFRLMGMGRGAARRPTKGGQGFKN